MLTQEMKDAVKDTLAVVISEQTNNENVGEIRSWLDTVNTPEDFFGRNTQGLREYNTFIKGRENEYERAKKRVTVS